MKQLMAINAGSSSLKCVLAKYSGEIIVKVLCQKIGLKDSNIVYKKNKDTQVIPIVLNDHTKAISALIDLLISKEDIINLESIVAIGHRIVHGGERFKNSIIIDEDAKKYLSEVSELAPLHNNVSLKAIEVFTKLCCSSIQVAVFDTSFHTTIPKVASIYSIPYEFYYEDKIKRYGFHGTSCRYVLERFKDIKKEALNAKILIIHLGNGSSITAVLNGKSVETSMGFTPLDGLVMGTRSGSIDPAIIGFISKKRKIAVSEVDEILNKKSGVLGISGLNSDFRDLVSKYENNERAKLAIDVFVHSVKKYIGAFGAVMNGLDYIILTGGIGENNFFIRKKIFENLEYLGVSLDKIQNEKTIGQEDWITKETSRVGVVVIPTNEEKMMLNDMRKLIDGHLINPEQ